MDFRKPKHAVLLGPPNLFQGLPQRGIDVASRPFSFVFHFEVLA